MPEGRKAHVTHDVEQILARPGRDSRHFAAATAPAGVGRREQTEGARP